MWVDSKATTHTKTDDPEWLLGTREKVKDHSGGMKLQCGLLIKILGMDKSDGCKQMQMDLMILNCTFKITITFMSYIIKK